MSNLVANGQQLYASTSPGSTTGSRIIIANEVLPRKKAGTVAGDYAIIFDDVQPSSAAANFSAIGCDSAGTVYIKSKLATYQFSDAGMVWPSPVAITSPGAISITSTGSSITETAATSMALSSGTAMTLTSGSTMTLNTGTNRSDNVGGVYDLVAGTSAQIAATTSLTLVGTTGTSLQSQAALSIQSTADTTILAGANTYTFESAATPSIGLSAVKWLGGAAGPFGTATNVVLSNLVNVTSAALAFMNWVRIGSRVIVYMAWGFDITAAAAYSFDVTFDELIAMRPTNFTTGDEAIGYGVGTLGAANATQMFYVSSVAGTKTFRISNPIAVAVTGASNMNNGSFMFLATD